MKEKILEISKKLENNEITEQESKKQFLFLFDVSKRYEDMEYAWIVAKSSCYLQGIANFEYEKEQFKKFFESEDCQNYIKNT